MTLMSLGLISIGVAAGILSGFFGIGGGILIVPALMYLFSLSQQVASGISLVALLLPVGILGVLAYYRAGKLEATHIQMGLWISLGLFLGAYLGAKIAIGLSPLVLRRAFAILLVAVAFKIWFSK